MASLLPLLLLFLAFLTSPRMCSSRKARSGAKEAEIESHLHPNDSSSSTGFDPSKGIQLSWSPRVFVYEGFLSDEECDHLISLAQAKLEKTLVTDIGAGIGTASGLHASSGMSLSKGQDEIVLRIEERISTWTFLPKENGEGIQIWHYGVNESYEPHYDYSHDTSKVVFGGHRVVSVLMYLSNVSRGGETIFPKSELKDDQMKDETWSDCAATGFAVKPTKGSALLFFNLNPDATPDESSLHGGCAVLEGEKWSAMKWIHVKAFDTRNLASVSEEECMDMDGNCPNWAANGECQKNAVYMLGTPDYYGSCRKSCGAC